MKNKRLYKERHVYFGNCMNGQHRYQSYKKAIIRLCLCRKHRKNGLSKDQIPLFEASGQSGFGSIHAKSGGAT